MANKNNFWCGPAPQNCDIYGEFITDTFIDGRTEMGPWAIMCEKCLGLIGVGLGNGLGQKYQRQDDGTFKKVDG